MQAVALFRSSIGKKIIMALTGLVWIGFVFFHMYGNLKVFQGALYFNEYAHGLRELGAPIFSHGHLLFVARIGLLVSMVLHVWSAITLTQQARKARPNDYKMRKVVQANYASLTIRYGGMVIAFFLIYHLMHFTWGNAHTDFILGDPYHNLVTGFQSAPAVFFYFLAVSTLGLHLYHGTWSMLQTLGLSSKSLRMPLRLAGLGLAGVLWVCSAHALVTSHPTA